jgi:hypothetical protein
VLTVFIGRASAACVTANGTDALNLAGAGVPVAAVALGARVCVCTQAAASILG